MASKRKIKCLYCGKRCRPDSVKMPYCPHCKAGKDGNWWTAAPTAAYSTLPQVNRPAAKVDAPPFYVCQKCGVAYAKHQGLFGPPVCKRCKKELWDICTTCHDEAGHGKLPRVTDSPPASHGGSGRGTTDGG